MPIYQPKEGTIAARALEVIEKSLQHEARGAWVSNLSVCEAIGVRPNAMVPSLAKCVGVGLVEKSLDTRGFTQWRLGVIKPRPQPKKKPPEPEAPRFSIPNWPPGFVSRFESVVVPSYEQRRK